WLPLLRWLRSRQWLPSRQPSLLRDGDVYAWSRQAMLPRQVLQWLRSRRWLPLLRLRQWHQSRQWRRSRPELPAGHPGRKPASPTRRRRKLRKGLKGCASYSWISLIWAALNGPQCDYWGYCYTRAIGVTARSPRNNKVISPGGRLPMTQSVYRLSALRLRWSPFTVAPASYPRVRRSSLSSRYSAISSLNARATTLRLAPDCSPVRRGRCCTSTSITFALRPASRAISSVEIIAPCARKSIPSSFSRLNNLKPQSISLIVMPSRTRTRTVHALPLILRIRWSARCIRRPATTSYSGTNGVKRSRSEGSNCPSPSHSSTYGRVAARIPEITAPP